jgi:dUTP pyrophosphatase
MEIKVYLKNKRAAMHRATPGSAGMDLIYHGEEEIKLNPTMRAVLPTGVFLAVPEGYEAQIRPRSGLALKHGLTVLNAPGTIDSDYRGEVGVILANTGSKAVIIKPGERIAQMVFNKIENPIINIVDSETFDDLKTSRGSGGFGSTGK